MAPREAGNESSHVPDHKSVTPEERMNFVSWRSLPLCLLRTSIWRFSEFVPLNLYIEIIILINADCVTNIFSNVSRFCLQMVVMNPLHLIIKR